MNLIEQTLGWMVELEGDFDGARTRVVDALKAEGFGVLTEIDVSATFKNKLNVDFQPYKILGACNPSLAHRALSATSQVGLLLPCNVTLSQEVEGRVQIGIVDPIAMLGVVHNSALQPVAAEAHERLSRVAAALQA